MHAPRGLPVVWVHAVFLHLAGATGDAAGFLLPRGRPYRGLLISGGGNGDRKSIALLGDEEICLPFLHCVRPASPPVLAVTSSLAHR